MACPNSIGIRKRSSKYGNDASLFALHLVTSGARFIVPHGTEALWSRF